MWSSSRPPLSRAAEAGKHVFLDKPIANTVEDARAITEACKRAKVVLAKLEQEDRAAPKGFEDLPLFAAPAKPTQERTPSADDLLAAALAAINPDDLSPREAMDALYRLKQQASKKTGN